MPSASSIEFPGTPNESADRDTRAVFGDYIGTYAVAPAADGDRPADMQLSAIARRRVAGLLVAVLGAFSSGPAMAQSWAKDAGFAPSFWREDFDPLGYGQHAWVEPSGSVLVFVLGGGRLNGEPVPQLFRLFADGTREVTFAPGPISQLIERAVPLADGRVILLSQETPASNLGPARHRLIRLTETGQIDATFTAPLLQGSLRRLLLAADGTVNVIGTNLSVPSAAIPSQPLLRFASDGTPAAIGGGYYAAGLPANLDVVSGDIAGDGSLALCDRQTIYKVRADGTVDATFSAPRFSDLRQVGFLSDGKLLVADGTLTRLLADGRLDSAFSAPSPAPLNASFNAFCVLPDGRIYVTSPFQRLLPNGAPDAAFLAGADDDWAMVGPASAGRVYARRRGFTYPSALVTGRSYGRPTLVLVGANGSVDNTFSPRLSTPGSVAAVAGDARGGVIACGVFDNVNGFPRAGVARFLPDGRIDPDFGPTVRPFFAYTSLAAQIDGSVIVQEFVDQGSSAVRNLYLARRFDQHGELSVSEFAKNGLPNGAVEADGSYLAAAWEQLNAPYFTFQVFLRRYHFATGDMELLPTQFPARTITPSEYELALNAFDVQPQPDGRIVIRGGFDRVDGVARAGVVRLQPDGTQDATFNAVPPVGWHLFKFVSFPDGSSVALGSSLDTGTARPVVWRQSPTGAISSAAREVDVGTSYMGTDGAARFALRTAEGVLWLDAKLDFAGYFDTPDQTSTSGGFAVAAGGSVFAVLPGNTGVERYQTSAGTGIVHQPQDVTAREHAVARFDVGFAAAAGLTYQWLYNGTPIAGATRATLTLAEVKTSDEGRYQTIVTANGTPYATRDAVLTVTPSRTRLANLSGRSRVGAGEAQQIAGFVTRASAPILIRAVGPGLRPYGVAGVLGDPTLTLRAGPNAIAGNAGWGGTSELAATFARLGAFPLAAGSSDAALHREMDEGVYTAGVTGSGGINLVEIYEGGDAAAASPLTNLSLRASNGSGAEAATAGFVITGTGLQKVLVRALGPALKATGVQAALADPKLQLFSASFTGPIAANDNADEVAKTVAAQVGALPLGADALDAAIVATLEPGAYSAQVSGGDGIVLLEVYAVEQ